MTDTKQVKSALVTGANSGLGFEAAAQLAEAGYGRVILACRNIEKATTARLALMERVGKDPFETLAVDVSSIASARAAVHELSRRAKDIDVLLLNAGIVSGKELLKSVDGFELTFASSLIGHHILCTGLLENQLLANGSRVIIVGSAAANNTAPAIMGMRVYDFAFEGTSSFGSTIEEAMLNFIQGTKPDLYSNQRYYSTTKLFSAWWSSAMHHLFGHRTSFFAVGPGPNMGTNVGRYQKGFASLIMKSVMPLVGSLMGINQPVSSGAKRFLDVFHNVDRTYLSGRTYTPHHKDITGPLWEVDHTHVLDFDRQERAWKVLNTITKSNESP
mgnify:FL=1